MKRYFPQGVATDHTFCNRNQERAHLHASIESNEHVVIVAPRRYGKTSLIAQVLRESSLNSINMDFFFVLSQAEVMKTITDGVAKLISTILPKPKATCIKLIDAVKALNPKLTFNLFGQKLEIGTKQTTEKTISEVLLALDQFAIQSKKNCVVVFDEFQQIGELKESHAVEAAIRHAVERSKNVSYIFCGSKRHLLNEMFSDKSRPLYQLCDLMTIDRISTTHYHSFLNNAARSKWKIQLNEDVLNEITHLTENHPYYINALCRRLWREDNPPSLSDVRNIWEVYVNKQSLWIINDLSRLTLNRKKVITALSIQSTNEPQGQAFSERVGMTPSVIKKSLDDLQKLDMIYQDKNKYYWVLDPAVAYFIRKNTNY